MVRVKTQTLLIFGIVSPLLFWFTTLVCGLILEDYSHLSNMVSELGAMGTKTQYVFTAGLLLSSILNVLFGIGLWRMGKALKLEMIPVVLVFCYSFLAGPAIFAMPHKLHGTIGVGFMLIMVSPVFGLVQWWKQEPILKIRWAAIVSFAIMMLGFLIFFPNTLTDYFGLKQRFLYLGWSLWSIFLSYRFLQLVRRL
mgnify:CR=1 FL=1